MNPAMIKQFLNSDLGKALDTLINEKTGDIQTKLGAINPAFGDTTSVMNFLKLIYNQLGQDDPVSADRTTIMNYLKLLEQSSGSPAPYTPGIRSMGLDVGATNNGLKQSGSVLSTGEVLEGFESITGGVPAGWTKTGTSSWNYASTTTGVTEGNQCFRLFWSGALGVFNTVNFGKSFDLTGIDALYFDVTYASTNSLAFGQIKIGSTVVWDGTGRTSYQGTVKIGVSAYTGVQTINLFLSVQTSSSVTVDFYIDNIRTGNSAGYLLKSLTRLSLDRITFPQDL